MGTIQHTQYGKATGIGFLVQVKPINLEALDTIREEVNTHHGALNISKYGDGWWVKTDDDSGLEYGSYVDFDAISAQLYTRAFENGWVDREGEVFTLDLAQFDPWDLGYCIQMAAFGEHIVG